MKKIFLFVLVLVLGVGATINLCAQQVNGPTYTGAVPTKDMYMAAYQLDNGDSAKIRGTLHNIANALTDARLTGKLKVELVVHGEGIKALMKDGVFEQDLKALKDKGVIIAECLNTMHARNITKEQLYDFVSFVPSGNGELIILAQQGWAVIHP